MKPACQYRESPAAITDHRITDAFMETDVGFPLHIIQTIGSLKRASGGAAWMTYALSRELDRLGARVDVVSTISQGTLQDDLLIPVGSHLTTTLVRGTRVPLTGALWSSEFSGVVSEKCNASVGCVIHDHGLWGHTNHSASCVAQAKNVALIVSTHGMLEPWALSHRAWKKRIAWWTYQSRDLLHASVLHATAPREADNLRRAGLRQPIAVVPIGIDLLAEREVRASAADGDRIALFVGRIHPVKGLLDLVEAWRRVAPTRWRLIIAGPDEVGHRAEVEQLIRAKGLTSKVEVIGEVGNEKREDLYRRANLFILPSHTENFGVVVPEALAASVPVITTKGTPWADLVSNQCGWWVDSGTESLADAISKATTLPPNELEEMGRRGRQFSTRFAWPQIGLTMLAVYQWMTGSAEIPNCVLPSEQRRVFA